MATRQGYAPSIFVCGPISRALAGSVFDTDLRAMIMQVNSQLTADGFRVQSAHQIEQWGAGIPNSSRDVLLRDWSLAQSADAMVFVLPADPSGELYRTDGTFIELGWALSLDKPMVLITDTRSPGRSYMFDGVLEVFAERGAVVDLGVGDELNQVTTILSARLAEARSRTTKTPRAVGFCCTTFGFGPVSKAVAVAEALRDLRSEYELVFAGSDIALRFARGAEVFDELVEVDTDRQPREAADALRECDAIVNSLNFSVLEEADTGPQHFIDSLAWMWSEIPASVARASKYHVQDYLLTDEVRARLPANARVVPPIVSRPFVQPRRSWEVARGHLLVHLGGCRNPHMAPDAYSLYVDNMLEGLSTAIAAEHQHPRVKTATVCGNPELLEPALARVPAHISPRFLTRREFVEEMRRAEFVMTSPGLTGTLEAISLDVPCGFLLPHNFSQIQIEASYRQGGLDEHLWPDPLDIDLGELRQMNEIAGVQSVDEHLRARIIEGGAARTAEAFCAMFSRLGDWPPPRSGALAPTEWSGSAQIARELVLELEASVNA